MDVIERFLKYVSFDTRSDENSGTVPSTAKQKVLGEYLADIGCYVILEGLTLDSFVADPSNPDCREGAVADLRSEADFGSRETVPGETDGLSDPTGEAPETAGAPDMEE